VLRRWLSHLAQITRGARAWGVVGVEGR
jgi:hypothetical protein